MAAYREARKQLDGNRRPTDLYELLALIAARISRGREGAIMSYSVWCALALAAACWLGIIVLVLTLTG